MPERRFIPRADRGWLSGVPERRAQALIWLIAAFVAISGSGLSGVGAMRRDPSPQSTIDHVVILYMENHSFNEVLGFLCIEDVRCDGVAEGTTSNGATVPIARAPDIVYGPQPGRDEGDQRRGHERVGPDS